MQSQSIIEKSRSRQIKRQNELLYAHPLPINQPISAYEWVSSFFGYQVSDPIRVTGHFHAQSRSVWVSNAEHAKILWQRGFFGKGNLSRSEPTWLKREINRIQLQKSGLKELTPEEVTAKRRAERKQFKQERADAILAAEAEAEAAFAANPGETPVISTVIPSSQTAGIGRRVRGKEEKSDVTLVDLTEEETPEDVEHLRLSLHEAFFLAWAAGTLVVLDGETDSPISIQEFWTKCLLSSSVLPKPNARLDNPFLVQYVVYHHFRSLGWVVKSGLKFCVDYLLYKRGPVFHHAEFAVVIIPSYKDPDDKASSPYNLPNSGEISWQWFSTIARVNAQVMKTLVLAYVSIPAMKDGVNIETPRALSAFSVREVVIRRFVAARMRD